METAIVGIVGALIGSLLTNVLRIFFDWRNRRERVRDIQTALRAEIRSQRHTMEDYADAGRAEDVISRIVDGSQPEFTPFLAQPVGSFVFDAIVSDVHILPGKVIDPVVLYYRQFRSLAALIEDMRTDAFRLLPAQRKADIYADYAAVGSYALELSDRALVALNTSLGEADAG